MPDVTLHFDNAREVQTLIGPRGETLAKIEQAFGVQITTRDLWMKIEGAEESVVRVRELLDSLRVTRQAGVALTDAGIAYAIQAFLDGREQDFHRLFANQIDVADGKNPIVARTFGQLKYLDAIRNCDYVFGLGPAGPNTIHYASIATAENNTSRNATKQFPRPGWVPPKGRKLARIWKLASRGQSSFSLWEKVGAARMRVSGLRGEFGPSELARRAISEIPCPSSGLRPPSPRGRRMIGGGLL